MLHTEYAWMTTEEIVQFTEFRSGGSSALERELALRLSAALAAIGSEPRYESITPEACDGCNARRPG